MKLSQRTIDRLIDEAYKASERAYSPYSKYSVGAALLCSDGKIYTGCNIENSSYSMTCCAERVAFFKAISSYDVKPQFSAIAIVGLDENLKSDTYCMPCGACRQVMSEFCGEDFTVICIKNKEDYKLYKLSELLPEAFSAQSFI